MARLKKKKSITHRRYQLKRYPLFFFSLSLVAAAFLLLVWWFHGWNGHHPVNLVIFSEDQLWLIGARPADKTLVEINIPPTTIVPFRGGEWQARALFGLSQIEKSSQPLAAVGWDLFEIPIDNVVYVSNWRGQKTSYQIGKISRLTKLKKTDSLFSLPETLRLIKFVRSLHPSQIIAIDLSQLEAVRHIVDPTGLELLKLDAAQLSPQITDWFQISQLRREGLDLAIEAVSQPSTASKLARALEHSGLHVVSVKNGKGDSRLLVADKKLLGSLTVKKLKNWLDLKAITGIDFAERADIVAFL